MQTVVNVRVEIRRVKAEATSTGTPGETHLFVNGASLCSTAKWVKANKHETEQVGPELGNTCGLCKKKLTPEAA